MGKESDRLIIDNKIFFKDLVSLCPDGIIAINRKGIIIIFNRAAESITGYTPEETIGKMSISELYHSSAMAREIKKDMYSNEFGGPGRLNDYEVEVVNKKGHKIPIRFSATLLWNKGEEVGSVGFFHDLTTQKRMEERLHQLSITDGLTGLYNHRHFFIVLTDEMKRAERYDRPLSLICLDLDNFKLCNDNFGHLEGDRILRLVGDVLRSVLRQTDRGFRYGGDEFMVLLPETDIKNASIVAQKIGNEFNSKSHILRQNKDFIICTMSIGIAQALRKEDIESFIKRADIAMYEAKKHGGNNIRKAKPTMGNKVVSL